MNCRPPAWSANNMPHRWKRRCGRRALSGQQLAIIMASRQVSDDAAFAILKGASQNSNRKLRDLAEDLVRETADVGDGAGGGIGTR